MEGMVEATGSIWHTKPWWCQPWSIVLSGAGLVAASWVLLHRWWISVPAAVAVGLWWGLFLIWVPAAYRQAIQEAEVANPEGR